MLVKEIGVKVKQLRESKNISQEFLADKLGISQTTVSALESGKSEKFDLLLADKLCKFFEVDFSYFLNSNGKQVVKVNKGNCFVETQNFMMSEKLIEQYELRIKEKDNYINKLEEIIKDLKQF